MYVYVLSVVIAISRIHENIDIFFWRLLTWNLAFRHQAKSKLFYPLSSWKLKFPAGCSEKIKDSSNAIGKMFIITSNIPESASTRSFTLTAKLAKNSLKIIKKIHSDF